MFKNSFSFIKISCIFFTLLLVARCSVFSFSVMLKWVTVEWKRNITNDYRIFVSVSFGKKGKFGVNGLRRRGTARGKCRKCPLEIRCTYTRLYYYYCTPWAFMISEYMHVTTLKLPSLIGCDTGFGWAILLQCIPLNTIWTMNDIGFGKNGIGLPSKLNMYNILPHVKFVMRLWYSWRIV